MNRKEKARLNLFLRYLLLIGLGIVMIYPLCWMIGASFKTNSELFSSAGIIPMAPTLDGYRNGFKGYEGMNLLHFMGNTCMIRTRVCRRTGSFSSSASRR